jgi:hypothetical protein
MSRVRLTCCAACGHLFDLEPPGAVHGTIGTTSNGFEASTFPKHTCYTTVSRSLFGTIPNVTPAEKANADKYFEILDTHRRGYIEADVAVPFMLKSKLPQEVLAVVWLAH